MSRLHKPCEREGCENDGKAVVRENPVNGTRLCPGCLYDEGQKRGWW